MIRETKYAIYNYSDKDSELIDSINPYLEECIPDILKYFYFDEPTYKASIIIFPTKKEFDDEYRKNFKNEPKDWCIGYAYQNNIKYVSLNDFENTSHKFNDYKSKEALTYYKKTLVHEYVHFVQKMFLNKNNINHCNAKYLTEGSAVYLSKQREGIRIVFDKTLEETLKGPSYDIWGALFKYLDNNYDKNFILNLFLDDNYAITFLKNELFEKVKNCYIKTKDQK